MARRTSQKPPSKTRSEPSKREAVPLYKSILLLFLAAISSTTSQLSLSPSHGSIPAALYHKTLTLATVILVLSVDSLYYSTPASQNLSRARLIPITASWAPVVHLLLVPTARSLGAVNSALLIECLAYVPTLALTLSASWRGFRSIVPNSHPITTIVPIILTTSLFLSFESLSARIIPSCIGIHEALTRHFLPSIIACASAVLLPSRLLLFAALPIFHTLTLNPHTPFQRAAVSLNATLAAEGFSLLARRESLTGYLSVLENQVEGFRVMRCDHSLLGGEWVPGVGKWPGGKGTEGGRGVVGEPVYSVFIMLEAVRLVRPGSGQEDSQSESAGTESFETVVLDQDAKALVM